MTNNRIACLAPAKLTVALEPEGQEAAFPLARTGACSGPNVVV